MKPIFCLCLILTAAVSCDTDKSFQKKGFKKSSRSAVPVTVMTAHATEEPFTLRAAGETEPSDFFHLKVSGPVHVQRVFVEEGQKVNIGDPLMSFDLREQRLKLAVAQAEIKEMELALEQNNSPRETVPNKPKEEGKEEEVEDLTVESLNGGESAGLRAVREATLERARAQVDLYESELRDDHVGSPVAGVVAKRRVGDGMTLETSDPLLEIARIDPLYFVGSLPVSDIPLLKKEGSVKVVFPALSGIEVRGEILNIGASVSKESDKVEVKLKLPNEEGNLRVGMQGEIVVATGEKRRLFSLPEEALIREGGRTYLFLVQEDAAHRVMVDLAGDVEQGKVRVRGGLKEGDLVVVKSKLPLKGNEMVEVK